jgi:hypothetical protein
MSNPRFIKSERRLATIRKIKEILPIENADRIDLFRPRCQWNN